MFIHIHSESFCEVVSVPVAICTCQKDLEPLRMMSLSNKSPILCFQLSITVVEMTNVT